MAENENEDAIIQWYPGHIAKLERELQNHLKQLDIVIEIRDARIPLATCYEELSQKIRQQKPVLLILNKSDLADPNWTDRWVAHFRHEYAAVIAYNSSGGKNKGAIISELTALGEPQMLKQEAKGLKRRAIRTGVVGMPNVGKSSLINTLAGVKKAQTGHRAGVTRTTQWVRLNPAVDLLDTPGLIPAKLTSVEMGQMLACVYSVGDAAFDEEAVIPFFLQKIERYYPGNLTRVYSLSPDQPITLESIAQQRHYILPGDQLDLRRTAQAILKDFRLGRLGRLTLERPES